MTDSVEDRLRAARIPVTAQRLAIARVLMERPAHLTADQVLLLVRQNSPEISRATVYNTLKTLSAKNLVRELIIDPQRTVYDSRLDPHHHIFYTDTGEVCDAQPGNIQVSGPRTLPEGVELEGVDVVIRVRRKTARCLASTT